MEHWKTINQKTIISVSSQRNNGQVGAILSSYKQLYSHEFGKYDMGSKRGQYVKELQIIIRCMQHLEIFFFR
ncbi:hypothetical protein GQ457_04G003950 [Hibiscus cannabinus]